MNELGIETTAIDGLLVVHLPVHTDARGWFKENWQRAKMTALGLPDFGPVQQNMSHNISRGATRGIHAEPWDKLVSLATGRIFGAWVDLREGPSFGTVVTLELGPETAVFVPRGVGNSYQALEDATTYAYLVNEHWSAAAREHYTYANLFDPALGIDWPIPADQCELSSADQQHPPLAEVTAMPPRRTLVVGANGQLGRALQRHLPHAVALGHTDLDITDAAAVAGFDFSGFDTIINAAAHTGVDLAETPDGRAAAWATNATAVAHLAAAARRHRLRLVHVSSDYVFDGTHEVHDETEPPTPLGVYGQSKAAGDLAAAGVEQHWVVRTSWVIGEGRNFVTTMAGLAARGINPQVVDDQFGRLTFADDLAAGIVHLLDSGAAPGTYNLTNSGPVRSWAQLAARIFELRGRDPGDVTPVSTETYAQGKDLAPRPRHSALSLDKITATGFTPAAADERLVAYLAELP
ncbi:sugar nucleotide-binding protein [Propionibacteriaceae bacterium Y1923]|uniref:sugar nucleotide-binding protein n=1 Tax=Aestuariimicrobium sp. Y1814 TaxID=3418742 RepID=UPI003C29A20F